MNDDIAVINEDPSAIIEPLNPNGLWASGQGDIFFNARCDRSNLTIACTGGDDKPSGDGENVTDVQDHSVGIGLLPRSTRNL